MVRLFRFKQLVIFIMVLFCFVSVAQGVFSKRKFDDSTLYSAYDKYPKIRFEDKVFILKHSTYIYVSGAYVNEYYKLKENKYNWTERIIINNYIQEKDPIEYGDNILKKDKSMVSLYQRKYFISVVGTNANSCKGFIKIIKAEPNKKGPGLQVLEYNYKMRANTPQKNMVETAKLIIDRNVVDLIQLRTPTLYIKEVNIK